MRHARGVGRPGRLDVVALATQDGRAEIMVNVDYKADQAFEVSPTMSNAEANDILAVSDRVVFFNGGTCAGDLTKVGLLARRRNGNVGRERRDAARRRDVRQRDGHG